VYGMGPTETTVLLQLQLVGRRLLVLGSRIIAAFTFAACQRYEITHRYRPFTRRAGPGYSIISLTTPAPTVRPPSRIAKRSPSSMAMGVISSAETEMLSPGITISTFSGNSTEPVTSVVRK